MFDSFFTKLEAYIAAAKAGAQDAAEKGALALEEFAAWIRAHASTPAGAGAAILPTVDATRLAACKAELASLSTTAPKGASAGLLSSGVLLGLLTELLKKILAGL